MEIVVTGRNVEVPEHFRVHVTEKIGRLERYDHKIVGLQVELFHEPNRRQLKSCQRVEITGRGRGAVARAEAAAGDFYAALDCAVAKLEGRLRRSHNRRTLTSRRSRIMAGRGGTGAVAVLDELTEVDDLIPGPRAHDESLPDLTRSPDDSDLGELGGYADSADAAEAPDDGDPCPGRIVRRKVHTARPMTIDDALSRMELVGHDFYLFADAESGEPSVVYRRRGYDYGVIRLAR